MVALTVQLVILPRGTTCQRQHHDLDRRICSKTIDDSLPILLKNLSIKAYERDRSGSQSGFDNVEGGSPRREHDTRDVINVSRITQQSEYYVRLNLPLCIGFLGL